MNRPKRTTATKQKLRLVKNSKARLYLSNMRTTVFKDKRKSDKYKNSWKKGEF